jgi:hypothetical protein
MINKNFKQEGHDDPESITRNNSFSVLFFKEPAERPVHLNFYLPF